MFQFAVICKMESTQCIIYWAKLVADRRHYIGSVSRGGGKENPSHFCGYLMCENACVRPGIVVKEKDVYHVSVRTNCTDALSLFV
jgi:hypothetical protein